MPRPVVSDVAEFLYKELAPLAFADEQYEWPLLHWCEAWGLILSELDYIVHTGPDGEPGWTPLVDPDLATESTIDFVGQLLGSRFPTGTSIDLKQKTIKDGGALYRGTPKALAGEIQKVIGNRDVRIIERNGSAYKFVVGVDLDPSAPAETIDAVDVAIRLQKVLGTLYTLIEFDDTDWDYFMISSDLYHRNVDGFMERITPEYPTYASLEAAFATYADLEANNPI